MNVARFIAVCLAALQIGALLSAQAVSKNWALVAFEHGDGGRQASTSYVLELCSHLTPVGAPSASTSYACFAGYAAKRAAGTKGSPWLMATVPEQAPLFGGTSTSLRGIDMQLGTAPRVSIGGVDASIQARTADAISVTVPRQTRPGWAVVEVATTESRTALTRGLAILPLLDAQRHRSEGAPIDVDFLGSQGDYVIWMVGPGRAAQAVSLPPIQHALEVDLTALVVVAATYVADRSGRMRLTFPGVRGLPGVVFQGLVLTEARGYAPASFTNLLEY